MTVPTCTPPPDSSRPEAAQTTGRTGQTDAESSQATAEDPAADTPAPAPAGVAGLIIRLADDPEARRLLEAREEMEFGGEPACLLPRLCPRCGAPGETSVNRICTNCGAALTR